MALFIMRCSFLAKVAFREKMVGHLVERASPYEALQGAILPEVPVSSQMQLRKDLPVSGAVCDIHAKSRGRRHCKHGASFTGGSPRESENVAHHQLSSGFAASFYG